MRVCVCVCVCVRARVCVRVSTVYTRPWTVHTLLIPTDEQVAQRLQEEVPYYDTSSSSAVEEQKRQFEQLRQLQEDAEMAMKLQEQLDAVSGSCDLLNDYVILCLGK